MFSKTLSSTMYGSLIGMAGMSLSTGAFANCTQPNCKIIETKIQVFADPNCGTCIPDLEALLHGYMANHRDVKVKIILPTQTLATRPQLEKSAVETKKRFVDAGVPAANIKVTVAPKKLQARPINRPIDLQR
jgi:hypothetical protein